MPDVILNQEFLEKSNNDVIGKLVDNEFITGAEAHHNVTPIRELRLAFTRHMLVNFRDLMDENSRFRDFSNKEMDDVTDEEIKAFLSKEFPGSVDGVSYADLLLTYFNQGPLYFVTQPLRSFTKQGQPILPGYVVIPGGSTDYSMHLYADKKTGKVFLETIVPTIGLTRDIDVVRMGGGAWKFELTGRGFRFNQAAAYSSIAKDVYAGITPPNLDAEFNRLLQLQKSLKMRILDAFCESFDTTDPDAMPRTNLAKIFGKPRISEKWNVIEALLGLPREGKTRNKIQYMAGGFLLSPSKNIVKLIVEFLPRVIENVFRFSADRLTEKFSNTSIKNPVLRNTAKATMGVAIGGLRLLQGVFYLTRKVTALVTSPIRSAKEAFGWVAKKLSRSASPQHKVESEQHAPLISSPQINVATGMDTRAIQSTMQAASTKSMGSAHNRSSSIEINEPSSDASNQLLSARRDERSLGLDEAQISTNDNSPVSSNKEYSAKVTSDAENEEEEIQIVRYHGLNM